MAKLMDLRNGVFNQFLELFFIVFIDDILEYSKSEANYVDHLYNALQTLKD